MSSPSKSNSDAEMKSQVKNSRTLASLFLRFLSRSQIATARHSPQMPRPFSLSVGRRCCLQYRRPHPRQDEPPSLARQQAASRRSHSGCLHSDECANGSVRRLVVSHRKVQVGQMMTAGRVVVSMVSCLWVGGCGEQRLLAFRRLATLVCRFPRCADRALPQPIESCGEVRAEYGQRACRGGDHQWVFVLW